VPHKVRGELARFVFPGLHGSQFGQAGEATPAKHVGYFLTIDCVPKSPSSVRVTYEVRDVAYTKRPSPNGRVITSGAFSCDGPQSIIGLPPLPRHPIEVDLSWTGETVAKAYAVIAPS
jgi:hypothetical protein